MPKILLAIGDAAEVLDTFYPLFRLQEAGFRVDVAGPEDRTYHLVLHERPSGWDITDHGILSVYRMVIFDRAFAYDDFAIFPSKSAACRGTPPSVCTPWVQIDIYKSCTPSQ